MSLIWPCVFSLLQVLVPLVMLQALQSEGTALASLLTMGVRYLEEAEADYIIQQGGWVRGLAPHHEIISHRRKYFYRSTFIVVFILFLFYTSPMLFKFEFEEHEFVNTLIFQKRKNVPLCQVEKEIQ